MREGLAEEVRGARQGEEVPAHLEEHGEEANNTREHELHRSHTGNAAPGRGFRGSLAPYFLQFEAPILKL